MFIKINLITKLLVYTKKWALAMAGQGTKNKKHTINNKKILIKYQSFLIY